MPTSGPRRAARRPLVSAPPVEFRHPPTPRWLYVGRVTSPFGVAGEVRVTLETDFPERLADRPLYVGDDHRALTVASVRLHRREALLKIAGVDSVEAADALRGQELFVAGEDAAPLPAGRYYIHELIGLEVWTVAGERYGEVTDVLSRPANDIYVIRHGDREVLAPAIADVVKSINLAERRMVIDVIPGLE